LPKKEKSMSASVAALLAFAIWTISVLALTIGIVRWGLIFAGKAELKSFPGDEPHGSPFYRRATRAHANCIENLPVFAAIVFAGAASGVQSATFDALAIAVVVARIFQTTTHLISGSNTAIGFRFSFLMVQLVAFFWMGGLVAIQGVAEWRI
jgi:uncharacterized MAPEG superfamily protein